MGTRFGRNLPVEAIIGSTPRGGFITSVTENMVTIIVKPVTIQEKAHLFTQNKNQFTVIISETNCTVNKGIRRVYGMNPFALRVILLPCVIRIGF